MAAHVTGRTVTGRVGIGNASSSVGQELEVNIWVYVSKAAAASQKPPKKLEKRDSVRPSQSIGELNPRRIKEKSSWLGLPRGSGVSDQWRAATCQLTEDGQGCQLRVFLDNSVLLQTIQIHLLNYTDIRLVHRSLFDRNHCIGIFNVAGQTWGPNPNTDPLYLQFLDSSTKNGWLALLRSYAHPEIYGRLVPITVNEGGLYRMWRQVDLTCMSGRNLGIARVSLETHSGTDSEADSDIFCEILINGLLSGRTAVQSGRDVGAHSTQQSGSPQWLEHFVFPDLPPFENLEIILWRGRKSGKAVMLGSTILSLRSFRRGETVDGWFPVLSDQTHLDLHTGDIRLIIKIDEEIILPYDEYRDMLKSLQAENYLKWPSGLSKSFGVSKLHLTQSFMAISSANNVLVENLTDYADNEIDQTSQSSNDLFRANTPFTESMKTFMSLYGTSFLEDSVGKSIYSLCSEKVLFGHDNLKAEWCRIFWKGIYEAREKCPNEMRKVFAHIRQLVTQRFKEQKPDLPWQAVSSFIFLRLIIPSILSPHLFGLWSGVPPVQRSLTSIAREMNNLANLNITNFNTKTNPSPVDVFLKESLPQMMDYIEYVSTARSETSNSSSIAGSHEMLVITSALYRRTLAHEGLYREAIPLLPHLSDLPRHLALITTTVVKHSRRNHTSKRTPLNKLFDDLCARCLEVEERAVFRVSRLARQQYGEDLRGPNFRRSSISPPASPISISTNRGKGKQPLRNSTRPSTAPSYPTSRAPSPPEASIETCIPTTPAKSLAHMLSRASLKDARQSQPSSAREHMEPSSILSSHTSTSTDPTTAPFFRSILRK